MIIDDKTRPAEGAGPSKTSGGRIASLSKAAMGADIARGTAFDRITEALRAQQKTVRQTGPGKATAQCPAHDDHEPSLTIYRRPGRAKLVCWPGCDDRDILAALGLGVGDLFDTPNGDRRPPDPAIEARIAARRSLTPVQRAVDDLLHLPDIGERISRSIIWHDNAERLGGGRDE